MIIRCFSVLWGKLLAKQNKCLEQTLDNKKRSEFLFVYSLFCFPCLKYEEYSTNKSLMCLPPDQTGWRLRTAGGQSSSALLLLVSLPSPPLSGNIMPVPLSCLPRIQQLKQVSSRFKVGSARAAVFWPFSMFCFSLMLMTVKPQRPPASTHQVLTQPLFTQAHNKSTTFLGWEIKTHKGGDNGERFTLELFRFGLVARLDNTWVRTYQRCNNRMLLKVC